MSDFATSMARVAVLPSKIWDGMNRLEDAAEGGKAQPIETYPLAEAFGRSWTTDAHFVIYLTAPFDPRRQFFRINKPCLREIRTKEFVDVHAGLIALDWDNPGHSPWDAAKWNAFVEARASALSSPGPFGQRIRSAFCEYSTKNGWRWVWRLRKKIAVDDAEPKIRGIAAEACAAGLEVDRSGSVLNWAQPFRLPKVMRNYARDGEPADLRSTENDPFFHVEIHPERELDVDSVASVGIVAGSGPSSEGWGFAGEGGRPSDDEAKNLLRQLRNGKWVETPFYKAAKEGLQGRAGWDFLFRDVPFDVSEGERHATVRGWAMGASGYVVRNIPYTPQEFYALFLRAAQEMSEGSRKDRRDEVWRFCLGGLQKEEAVVKTELRHKVEVAQEKIEKSIATDDSIAAGVRSWYRGLPEDPIRARAWIRKRAILKEKRAGRFYVIRSDGTYAAEPVDEGSLIPQIIQQGMAEPEGMIPVSKEAKDGTLRALTVADLSVRDGGYVTNVSDVQPRCEVVGSFLENPDDSEAPTLVTLSFRRNPKLAPLFNPDVDLWIRALTGALYDFFCRHVGCFIAWERGGVAAMSFNMVPAAGKKLLAHGLLEVLEDYARHVFATGEDLVQQFNGKLRLTPYIFVNEGMPDGLSRYHASDTLRRVITGDYFQLEGKNKDSQSFKFPFRVLLTANHWRLIDAMGEGRDLSPQERIALGERLVHYPGDGSDAARFLAERGGDRFTRGWIEGDSGEPSRFVVARHFLWLWEHFGRDAHTQGRGRLLVEGDPSQPAIRRLRIRGGSTPVVMEALVRLLGQASMGAVAAKQGIRTTSDGRLFVTTSAILDYWRNNLTRGSGDRLSTSRVGLSLKGLVVGSGSAGDMRSVGGEKARFHEIDVLLLADEAANNGWMCQELDKLVEMRRAAVAAGSGNGNGAAHATPSGRLPAIMGGGA